MTRNKSARWRHGYSLLGGYRVKMETDGNKVVETASEFMPDLILLDLIMPDIEETEVNRRLQKDRRLKKTPVVFMTGILTDEEVDVRDGEMFGRPCIAKPITKEKLLACVAAQLG